jgi:hypothetical protein
VFSFFWKLAVNIQKGLSELNRFYPLSQGLNIIKKVFLNARA